MFLLLCLNHYLIYVRCDKTAILIGLIISDLIKIITTDYVSTVKLEIKFSL